MEKPDAALRTVVGTDDRYVRPPYSVRPWSRRTNSPTIVSPGCSGTQLSG